MAARWITRVRLKTTLPSAIRWATPAAMAAEPASWNVGAGGLGFLVTVSRAAVNGRAS